MAPLLGRHWDGQGPQLERFSREWHQAGVPWAVPRQCHQAGGSSPELPGCAENLHPPQPASHSPSGGVWVQLPGLRGDTRAWNPAPHPLGAPPVSPQCPHSVPTVPGVTVPSDSPACAHRGVHWGLSPNTPQSGCGWRARAVAAVTLGCWGFRDLEHPFSSFLLFFSQLCHSSTHPLVTTQATS